MAGADILETNTFSSTRIAQADYGMQEVVYELNRDGARLAQRAALKAERLDGKPRFVAGALGPTNRTASISPDVNNPGFRAVTFDELRDAYAEQVDGLIDGGADLILIETIFDTLNAKAAIFACEQVFDERGRRLPMMISGTITDRSGRTLSGQTPTAFWHSVRHARPFTIGLNCALGAAAMREHLEEIAGVADTLVCAYPNAGLPNEFGRYDETPDEMAGSIAGFARDGLVNIVGGCCGTTPEHIRAIAEAVRGVAPRAIPEIAPRMRLSGLEPFTLTTDIPFVNVGERTNVTGLGEIPQADHRRATTPARSSVARDQVANGAQIIDVNMDEGLIDSAARDGRVPQPRRRRARHRARAGDDRFLEVLGDRGRAQMRAGQGDRQLDLDEGGRGGVPAPGAAGARLRRRRRRDGVRRTGPGRHVRAQGRDLRARLQAAHRGGRLSARGHRLRSQHLRGRDRHRGAQRLRRRLHRGDAARSSRRCRMSTSPAASPTSRSRSAATSRCARRCTRCSSTTRSRPAWTWASSTPASSRSTRRSSRSCARPARTSCSTAAPTPPSGC